jgi:hypothetical protein
LSPDGKILWTIPANLPANAYRFQQDALSGRQVLVNGGNALTINSRSAYDDAEMTALVRIVTTQQRTAGTVEFRLRDKAPVQKPDIVLQIVGQFNSDYHVYLRDQYRRYDIRAYDAITPTWPEIVRSPIEKDMAALPRSQDKWVRLRYVIHHAA